MLGQRRNLHEVARHADSVPRTGILEWTRVGVASFRRSDACTLPWCRTLEAAKKLLAEAGQPNSFDLKLTTINGYD
jgi:hypothetical protein